MKEAFFFIFWFCSKALSAQSVVIKGKLQDDSGNAVVKASIIMQKEDNNKFSKAVLSDTGGRFTISTADTGKSIINISAIGFESTSKKIETVAGVYDLGTIELNRSSQNLAAVQVVAEKPIVQVLADKTVFNVENTINATGVNGWELLRKAPGLIIDNSGSIIVEGKSGVQVYIDGKPSPLRGTELQAYLETLQSSDISSIEIITQPSSRYDAAGNAGIINIKLKKNKNFGTNGSLTSGITYGKFARYSTSVSLNNRTSKGNLFGTYSNGMGKYYNYLYLYRLQNGLSFDARTDNIVKYNSNNFRIGYDRFLNSKSTIGLLVNTNLSNNKVNSDSRTPIKIVGAISPDSILVANNISNGQSGNFNVNLNYRFADTSGHLFNIDADYGRYKYERDAYQPNLYYDSKESQVLSKKITRQETPINIDIATLKADYEQNFIGGKLALGFKFSYVKTNNIFDFYDQVNDVFILNKTLSNTFNYTENINAAYVNFNKKWKQWNIQAGLRLENTLSDGNLSSTQNNVNNRVKRNYTNLFPSGGFTWQANKNNQWGITYSKRIERPNYSSLNPFEFKLDELSYRRGNPFLQPQYTDNIKLSHTFKYKLSSAISYSYIRDFFAQITEAEADNKNFISQRNIANQSVLNFSVSYPFKIVKWWNVYFSLSAFSSSYKATNQKFVAITQETLSLYAQNTIQLPSAFTMEVSGWFSSPSVWGGTYKTKSLGALNIAFQKKLLMDKLNARLAFNDIFFTSPWKGTTQFGSLFINGGGGGDSRTVAVSLTYNFGSDKVKKARSRKTGLDEENGRTGNQ